MAAQNYAEPTLTDFGICTMFARFPLELDAFGDEELGAHLASVHKYCQFCNEYFYGEGGGKREGRSLCF